MLPLLLTLCIYSLSYGALGEASCEQSGRLTVLKKVVQRKGYEFEKAEVNRSVPIELIYTVLTNGQQADSIEFEHNKKSVHVGDDSGSEVYYSVETVQSSLKVRLHIRQPAARSSGEWTMILKTGDGQEYSAACTVDSPPILRLYLGAIRANEGKTLSATCHLDSISQAVEIKWERYSDSDDGRSLGPVQDVEFKTENGVTNNVIEWKNSSKASGFYLCTATSQLGSDTTLIEVRIKTLWTYLWPSIGILLELIVLVITIAIYERSQAKKRRAQSDRSLNGNEK